MTDDLMVFPDYTAFLAVLALHTTEETGLTYPQLVELLKTYQIRGVWRMGSYTAHLPAGTVFYVPSFDVPFSPRMSVDFDVFPWDNESHELWLDGGYECRDHSIQPLWD